MLKEILLVAGIGAGVAALVFAIIKAIGNYKANKDAENVVRIYVDELNTGEIKMWFVDKIQKETLKGAILYPTPENIVKWKIQTDASNQDNMLIQAVYDEEKDEIIDYREVIFGKLSSKLQELLDTNGGMLVIEN